MKQKKKRSKLPKVQKHISRSKAFKIYKQSYDDYIDRIYDEQQDIQAEIDDIIEQHRS